MRTPGEGDKMSEAFLKEAPKPLSCTIEGGETRATFDFEEVAQFVRSTKEDAFIVMDEKGNQSAILVAPIEELLQELS
jgi:hypothetical protein